MALPRKEPKLQIPAGPDKMTPEQARKMAALGEEAWTVGQNAGHGEKGPAFQLLAENYGMSATTVSMLAKGFSHFRSQLREVLLRLGTTNFTRLMKVRAPVPFLQEHDVWAATEKELLQQIQALPENERGRSRSSRFRNVSEGLGPNLDKILAELEAVWTRASYTVEQGLTGKDRSALKKFAKELRKLADEVDERLADARNGQ